MNTSARAVQPTAADERKPYQENTVFLIPDIPYDQSVIKGYLKKTYKNIPADMIVSQINSQVLPHLADLAFVVCVRRGLDGAEPGRSYDVVPDERGILREKPISPDTYHGEVVESPIIRVRDHVKVQKANMFANVETDLRPLVNVLCDHASPCRIWLQNKPDFMIRCVVAA